LEGAVKHLYHVSSNRAPDSIAEPTPEDNASKTLYGLESPEDRALACRPKAAWRAARTVVAKHFGGFVAIQASGGSKTHCNQAVARVHLASNVLPTPLARAQILYVSALFGPEVGLLYFPTSNPSERSRFCARNCIRDFSNMGFDACDSLSCLGAATMRPCKERGAFAPLPPIAPEKTGHCSTLDHSE
jgi:hypothetical protein